MVDQLNKGNVVLEPRVEPKPAHPVLGTKNVLGPKDTLGNLTQPRVDPRTGEPVQYQEVADTRSDTPASEKLSATTTEKHREVLQRVLDKILREHGSNEAAINLDHEYWQLKEIVTGL